MRIGTPLAEAKAVLLTADAGNFSGILKVTRVLLLTGQFCDWVRPEHLFPGPPWQAELSQTSAGTPMIVQFPIGRNALAECCRPFHFPHCGTGMAVFNGAPRSAAISQSLSSWTLIVA